ncbi:hypothetical protein AXG93_1409s1030 [Marchantia polymorpha subsp. ruderalis]|uniref:Uncharacterized protein n=1 Tax=Marchantia polymorpha subsp. ruderalis TaxID=1480154 RepID=A0A176WKR0_MARPO|nr:hypothetical protein AXG93_1409s1030 [Marchantia polymorpha subsp. ruderalis]
MLLETALADFSCDESRGLAPPGTIPFSWEAMLGKPRSPPQSECSGDLSTASSPDVTIQPKHHLHHRHRHDHQQHDLYNSGGSSSSRHYSVEPLAKTLHRQTFGKSSSSNQLLDLLGHHRGSASTSTSTHSHSTTQSEYHRRTLSSAADENSRRHGNHMANGGAISMQPLQLPPSRLMLIKESDQAECSNSSSPGSHRSRSGPFSPEGGGGGGSSSSRRHHAVPKQGRHDSYGSVESEEKFYEDESPVSTLERLPSPVGGLHDDHSSHHEYPGDTPRRGCLVALEVVLRSDREDEDEDEEQERELEDDADDATSDRHDDSFVSLESGEHPDHLRGASENGDDRYKLSSASSRSFSVGRTSTDATSSPQSLDHPSSWVEEDEDEEQGGGFRSSNSDMNSERAEEVVRGAVDGLRFTYSPVSSAFVFTRPPNSQSSQFENGELPENRVICYSPPNTVDTEISQRFSISLDYATSICSEDSLPYSIARSSDVTELGISRAESWSKIARGASAVSLAQHYHRDSASGLLDRRAGYGVVVVEDSGAAFYDAPEADPLDASRPEPVVRKRPTKKSGLATCLPFRSILRNFKAFSPGRSRLGPQCECNKQQSPMNWTPAQTAMSPVHSR